MQHYGTPMVSFDVATSWYTVTMVIAPTWYTNLWK